MRVSQQTSPDAAAISLSRAIATNTRTSPCVCLSFLPIPPTRSEDQFKHADAMNYLLAQIGIQKVYIWEGKSVELTLIQC